MTSKDEIINELEAEIKEANENANWWRNRYHAYQIINKDLRKSHKDLSNCLNNLLQLLDLDKKYVSIYKNIEENDDKKCTDEHEEPRDWSYLDNYWKKGGTYVLPSGVMYDIIGDLDDLVDKINRIIDSK